MYRRFKIGEDEGSGRASKLKDQVKIRVGSVRCKMEGGKWELGTGRGTEGSENLIWKWVTPLGKPYAYTAADRV